LIAIDHGHQRVKGLRRRGDGEQRRHHPKQPRMGDFRRTGTFVLAGGSFGVNYSSARILGNRAASRSVPARSAAARGENM
jgi:hypothetical protein